MAVLNVRGSVGGGAINPFKAIPAPRDRAQGGGESVVVIDQARNGGTDARRVGRHCPHHAPLRRRASFCLKRCSRSFRVSHDMSMNQPRLRQRREPVVIVEPVSDHHRRLPNVQGHQSNVGFKLVYN